MNKDQNLTLEALLQDGFSKKMGTFYLKNLKEEMHHPLYEEAYGAWAHENGFWASDTYAMDLERYDLSEYMRRYDYCKMWPSNSWSKIWIDDKLTLKYILAGTEFADVMPEYYFYSTKDGLRSLMDNPYPGQQSIQTLLQIVKEKGAVACKPNNGSLAVGFFKLSYAEGRYYLNDRETEEAAIIELVNSCPNYVFTEFFYPCKALERIHPMVQTLRVVVLNSHGNDPVIVSKYFRYGMDGLGAVNYGNKHDADDFNLYAHVDLDEGKIYGTFKQFFNRSEPCPFHPDTHRSTDVRIPELREVKPIALGMAKYFSNLEWMGYDFCLTPDGIKLMEINSHPDIRMMQAIRPLYQIPQVKEWMEKKLRERESACR